MKRVHVLILALGAAVLCSLPALSQPGQRGDDRPGGDGPPRGRGPGGGPPGFKPGIVLPPHIRSQLKLTKEQQKQLARLEAEVKEKLLKILTDEQKKKLEKLGRQPPPGGRGGSGRGGRGGRGQGDGDGDRPPRREKGRDGSDDRPAGEVSKASGIQWFATWESGLKEAKRTGRPILLVSAAPHCAGVPGTW